MNIRIEQLLQIYDDPVWDGDLISKDDRDALRRYGLVTKYGSMNCITERGVKLCAVLDLRDGKKPTPTYGGGRWA